MTESQERHLLSIKERLRNLVDAKYRAGAAEHGGELCDLPVARLLDEIINETVDQATYLLTLRDKLVAVAGCDKSPSTPDDNSRLAVQFALVLVEIDSARVKHGPLTADLGRAFMILSEEVGEVSRAVLEARRAQRNVQDVGVRRSLEKIKSELVQVAATALLMHKNIQEGGWNV